MTIKQKFDLAINKGYRYDPITGYINHTKENIGTIYNGRLRFSVRNNNKTITLSVSRFAFYYMKGIMPSYDLDHIDMNPLNNKWNNLRDIKHQHNCFNKKSKGYSFCKKSKKYRARIVLNSISYDLGSWDSEKEAIAAYIGAKKILHIIP